MPCMVPLTSWFVVYCFLTNALTFPHLCENLLFTALGTCRYVQKLFAAPVLQDGCRLGYFDQAIDDQ